MPRKSHHLVPNPNGGWDVKKGGSQRASIHTETKAEGEKRGREISRNQGTEFVIHGRMAKFSDPIVMVTIPIHPKINAN